MYLGTLLIGLLPISKQTASDIIQILSNVTCDAAVRCAQASSCLSKWKRIIQLFSVCSNEIRAKLNHSSLCRIRWKPLRGPRWSPDCTFGSAIIKQQKHIPLYGLVYMLTVSHSWNRWDSTDTFFSRKTPKKSRCQFDYPRWHNSVDIPGFLKMFTWQPCAFFKQFFCPP